MPRSSSSRDRAFAEPIVALAAVLALSIGVVAYASLLDSVGSPTPTARPTLERVHDAVTVGGVADPDRLDEAAAATWGDRRVNVTLAVAGRHYSAGDTPPNPAIDTVDLTTATRRLGVALAPGRIRPGRLRVTVWR